MKIAVIYHSVTGNTEKMAQTIAEGVRAVDGVEAQAFPIDAVDENYVAESSCVILGTPVYLASMSAQVKTWLDGAGRKYKLAGKLAGAFATANYIHGGGEVAVQSILSHFMVCGMMAYSGGGAYGIPVIHMGPVAIAGRTGEFDELFRTYGQRMAQQTLKLFANK